MRCIFLQFCLNWIIIGLEEIFPLFYASSQHGLGLQPFDVGGALSPLGLALLCWPLVYPHLERRLGCSACFRAGVLLFLGISIATPGLKAVRHKPRSLWAGLVAISILRGIAGASVCS